MSAKRLVIPITPMGKPRMSQRDKWMMRPVVLRWRGYADYLRHHAEKGQFSLPTSGGRFVFYLPMPRTWSEKKKRQFVFAPHTQKPDLDNLLKGVFDALLPDEDCTVWSIAGAEKRWSIAGEIIIDVPS